MEFTFSEPEKNTEKGKKKRFRNVFLFDLFSQLFFFEIRKEQLGSFMGSCQRKDAPKRRVHSQLLKIRRVVDDESHIIALITLFL